MKSRLFTKVFVVLTSFLFVAAPAFSVQAVELFRYRYHADDGRKFECVFETDEKNTPRTVGEEKAAEIAADWDYPFLSRAIRSQITSKLNLRIRLIFL